MCSNNPPSKNESISLLNSESEKLENIINQAFKNFDKLSINEIIEAYYQAINVASLSKFLRQSFEIKNTEEEKPIFTRIREIENFIDVKFNINFHPFIMSYLEKTIDKSKKNLNNMTRNQGTKTKDEIENQAKMFERLRQLMSTKEFVDQYQKELKG